MTRDTQLTKCRKLLLRVLLEYMTILTDVTSLFLCRILSKEGFGSTPRGPFRSRRTGPPEKDDRCNRKEGLVLFYHNSLGVLDPDSLFLSSNRNYRTFHRSFVECLRSLVREHHRSPETRSTGWCRHYNGCAGWSFVTECGVQSDAPHPGGSKGTSEGSYGRGSVRLRAE